MTAQLELVFDPYRTRPSGGLPSPVCDTGLPPLTVTVPVALRLTGIGRTKLYELIAEQAVRTVMVGRRRLIVFSSLEQLLGTAAPAD